MKKEKQMTAPPGVDAPFDQPRNWKALYGTVLWQQVRRLQVRIAKAIRNGDRRKALGLQWLLTHSRAARLLAVRRVTTNRGAKTPGVDNVIWRTDRQKFQAADNLKRHGYKPKPLRRIYIPKKNGKLRPLSIPTLRDRAMQALYALARAPVAETLAMCLASTKPPAPESNATSKSAGKQTPTTHVTPNTSSNAASFVTGVGAALRETLRRPNLHRRLAS